MEHKTSYHDYSLFFKFIEKFEPTGYVGIDRNDPLVQELEEMTESNNQYFFIGDLIEAKILFTSKRSIEVIGIAPDELTPYHGVEAVHPDEVKRNTAGWGKLINQGNDLFRAKDGIALLSVNMKMRNPKGVYAEMLYQDFMFYSKSPRSTVYVLQVHTNLEPFKLNKNGLHYYAGNDRSNFRYPDDKLLSQGYFFTKREFEILKLIESGLTNDDIADKLCISVYTINNHRANILAKSDKPHISDVILELHEIGY